MKVRQCFVSNSSSASFVLAKAYMTKDQIEKFREFIAFVEDYFDKNVDIEVYDYGEFLKYIEDIDRKPSEGGIVPNEQGKYFLGTIDMHLSANLSEFLKDMGVNEEDWEFGD